MPIEGNAKGICHDGYYCLQYMTHFYMTVRPHSIIYYLRRQEFPLGRVEISEDLTDFCCGMLFDACGRHASELLHIVNGPSVSLPKKKKKSLLPPSNLLFANIV